MARRSYPLSIHIAAALIALVVAVGGIATWLSYVRTVRMLQASAVELAIRSTRVAGAELERVLAPVRSTVRLLALQPVTSAKTLETRLASLEFLAEALRLTEPAVSYYVGYPDGDFFLVRRLSPEELVFFSAPAGTRFVAQSVEREGGHAQSRYTYFDEGLKPLGSAVRPEALAFDPRARPWYTAALDQEGVIRTDSYVFFTTGRIGSTVALRARGGQAVVAADVELGTLSRVLSKQKVTPGTRVVLFDSRLRIMGADDSASDLIAQDKNGSPRPAALSELGDPALSRLAAFAQQRISAPNSLPAAIQTRTGGRDVLIALARLELEDTLPAYLGLVIPSEELIGEARTLRNHVLMATGALMAVAVLLALWLSSHIARPLNRLSTVSDRIRHFDFSQPVKVDSTVSEVEALATTLDEMKATMARFLEITAEVASESNFERLLPRLLDETARTIGADGGILYLVGKEPDRLFPAVGLCLGEFMPLDKQVSMGMADAPFELAAAIRNGQALSRPLRDDEKECVGLLIGKGSRESLVAVPLLSRDKTLVGGLVLFSGAAADSARLAFISTLSDFAAISLEARNLIQAQKELFEAFLRLLAGAIDAKSHYTAGHCRRVPEIATMLAEAACEATEGPYRHFQLNADQWEAVRLAAWMHDWGKVTTPEYVVDKATKLETIYDRIHEVRMRFEVLKRDAEVVCWRAIAEGRPKEDALATLQGTWRTLDEEFAFVAQCNLGGEAMTEAQLERLHAIARRTWQRTLDDRLGVGHEELKRMGASPPLPVTEVLLADKPEHCIARHDDSQRFGEGNPWGFRMEVPKFLYNRGELYNLSVARGTLTEEERFKINEHVIQTIIMLSALPFPRHLASIPEIAGGHHEFIDGNGYPKRLHGQEMSPLARMIAIADIFEALTAVDRPYKRGKTLSETLGIMGRMRDEGHIDGDLFELFLRAGVYQKYADHFMQLGQIDPVEIERYLSRNAA